MKVSNGVIMLIVVSWIVIGGYSFIYEFASSYDMIGTTPELDYLNSTVAYTISNITSNLQGMQTTMVNRTGINIIDNAWNFIGFMSGAFINAALLFFNLPSLVTNMLFGMFGLMHIPSAIQALINLIVLALISFAIYRTVAKSDI